MKIDDNEKDLILLRSLPISFENYKNSLLYGKETTIIFDEVHTGASSKEFLKVRYLKTGNNFEGLSVSRGGSKHGWISKSKRLGISKVIKCFTYHKIGHLMRDYPEKKGNNDFDHIAVVSY